MWFQNGNIDPVESNEWFHGDITKDEAADRLATGKYNYCFFPPECNVFLLASKEAEVKILSYCKILNGDILQLDRGAGWYDLVILCRVIIPFIFMVGNIFSGLKFRSMGRTTIWVVDNMIGKD